MSNVFLSGFDGTITASTYAVISSEFNAANTASWLTTSYLITSTAFQPLYGRFSDVFGRRVSFFTATITFVVGCLGCGVANDIVFLNTMRALTGIGGGGLMTMGKSHFLELEGRTHTVQLQLSTPTSSRSDVGVCIKLCKTACMASAPSVVRLLVARLSTRLDGDGASLCRCL
jgi:MFS family permease